MPAEGLFLGHFAAGVSACIHINVHVWAGRRQLLASEELLQL
jgi:hypothetical protein